MNTLLFMALLLLLGFGGVVALVSGICVLLFRRQPNYTSVAALEAFDRRVVGWGNTRRLAGDQVEHVRALIAADRAELLGWGQNIAKQQITAAKPQEAPGSSLTTVAGARQQGAEAMSLAEIATPLGVTAIGVALPAPDRAPRPAPAEDIDQRANRMERVKHAPAPTARRPLHSALLALTTRRTLLFLGSFLLAISALTLVIFNWASFPPLIQFGLLTSVVGGLWAGGIWMARQPDLSTAGRNVQAVAALLVPVVAFALTRPGLLALSPRPSWLMVSLLSLPIYLLAAWRTERGFYSFSAAITLISVALAAQFDMHSEWLLIPLAPLLSSYLALAWWLRSRTPALAAGPYWIAHIALPTAVISEILLGIGGYAGSAALAAMLGLSTIFYLLATWIEQRPVWSLLTALLLPITITLGVDATGLPVAYLPSIRATLALAYLGIGVALEQHRLPLARPIVLIAPLLAGAALLTALSDSVVARTTLPLLIAWGLSVIALVERGQLAWIGIRRYLLATAGLVLAALLLPMWLITLLDLTRLDQSVYGLIMLPLAGAYFCGAHWWPGKLRRSYDHTLQITGTLIALLAGATTLADEQTWLPGMLLLTLLWGFQATLRRGSLWTTFALGSTLMIGWQALLRTTELSYLWWIWIGLGYTAAYAIGGSLLRHGQQRHWTWPAIGWATLIGLLALRLCLKEILLAGGAILPESLAILTIAGLLVLMTWLWRQSWLGYPAALLLVLGMLLAAQRGFYTGWVPVAGDLALVTCGLATALGLLGQGLRARASHRYALPYEHISLALITGAPLLAGGDSAHLSLTWLAMAGLYGLATWRYRLPWLLAAAWLALDVGLLHGSDWIFPGIPAEGASLILLAAVSVQSLTALWLRRSITSLLLGTQNLPGAPSYTAATIGGLGALLIATGSASYLAGVALSLAVILGIVATGEQSKDAPWITFALLSLGLGSLHHTLGLTMMASFAWGLAEALSIYAVGWMIASQAGPRWQIWHTPLRVFPVVTALATGLGLTIVALAVGNFGYLAVGLGGISLLLALVARRESQPWFNAAALICADLATLALAHWQFPDLSSAQLAPIMLIAATAQAAGAIWVRGVRAGGWKLEAGSTIQQPRSLPLATGLPFYTAAGISGILGLMLAWGDEPATLLAALALAGVAGMIAWFERRKNIAWLSVGLASLGIWVLLSVLEVSSAWRGAWMISELLGMVIISWGLERLNGHHWREPGSFAPLGLALLSLAGVAISGSLPALTFALAGIGLLLTTLAVRLRTISYGYAAGAALVGAGMCQLGSWGVREIQGYVLPAGIYLLALASGLRHFQGQRKVSQVIEAGAAMLLLGATLGQAIRDNGNGLYEFLLCGESLIMTAYGVLLRLRIPFVAGVSAFVIGVIWATIDNIQVTNQWVIFGSVGLLMIAAYVLLERYQERLLRLGRAWATELRGWG
ncbi:MAG: DUF2157 domain-containing protein [Oscillochloris sp.]|nr:DUF2157 domain-containing protein [Oscillochloris sp.]